MPISSICPQRGRLGPFLLLEKSGSVTVTVCIAGHTQLICSTCGKSCSIHDHRRRRWRHLDTCQITTLVEADVPRVDCQSTVARHYRFPGQGQAEMKQIPSSDRKRAHRSRYLWFYSKQNRYGRRAERLEVARLALPQTHQCWVMKELARDLWHRRYDDHSRKLWQEWMMMVKDTGIPLMVRVARMVAKRLYGILNAMRNRVSNGNAESLNSKIRLLRIKSRGFRNKEQFKLCFKFYYGKLNMAF